MAHARLFLLAASLLLCVLSASAQMKPSVPARVSNFIRTHKRLLVADSILILAWSADAASSVHAQKSGCCVESNPIVGPHPSEAATWGFAMGMAGLMVTGEHLIWWAGNKYDEREAARVAIWLPPIAFGITEFYNVKANAQYAGQAEARARLSH